ncbi:MAG TPA: sigma 54-interacting transcriptional regulator, partial [Pyrinomonadaceae bacterium]|nr:sigma 54-interacting transcriptional regulator [Pyrinomonadaceae bacterium]
MSQDNHVLPRLDDPNLSFHERTRLRCSLAKDLEDAGNYEAACRAMGELWRRVGERPELDQLDQRTAAEVLLRIGSLSGWVGSARQITGAQEAAKDLISESIAIFETLDERAKAAEAQTEMAWCYWREGAFNEARIVLQNAVTQLGDQAGDLKAVALLRSAIVEIGANQLSDALRILTDASPLFEVSGNHALKGNFHNTLANVLENLIASVCREDYTDRALIEYAAASFHFEQAGHTRHRARVENNLGFLLYKAAKFREAHEHLDRARRLFVNLKDSGCVAQVDETRARALLAQGQNSEAERAVRSAVQTLENGGEQALLAEALTTHGRALARLGRHAQARAALERAMEVAEQTGDSGGAGRAALTIIEELNDQLTPDETHAIYGCADQLLARSQHPETLDRLRLCARRVIAQTVQARPEEINAPGFVHVSEKTADVLRYAHSIAVTDGPLLITGETGTGKETLARLVHGWSGRAGQFVAVHCAALSDTPNESPLFEHKKGGLNGIIEDHLGVAREAAGGTLFLNEIGDLSISNQAELLRLIEYGEIYSADCSMLERLDVRIIAATNRDLRQEV